MTYDANMFPHSVEEWNNIVEGGGMNKLTVIKYQTNPEVVHEDWETGHDRHDAPWSSELIPCTVVVVSRTHRSA